jgi:hypothetical protein
MDRKRGAPGPAPHPALRLPEAVSPTPPDRQRDQRDAARIRGGQTTDSFDQAKALPVPVGGYPMGAEARAERLAIAKVDMSTPRRS